MKWAKFEHMIIINYENIFFLDTCFAIHVSEIKFYLLLLFGPKTIETILSLSIFISTLIKNILIHNEDLSVLSHRKLY